MSAHVCDATEYLARAGEAGEITGALQDIAAFNPEFVQSSLGDLTCKLRP